MRSAMNLHEPPVHTAMAVGRDGSGDDGAGQQQDDDE
jgi:hypothetical protein